MLGQLLPVTTLYTITIIHPYCWTCGNISYNFNPFHIIVKNNIGVLPWNQRQVPNLQDGRSSAVSAWTGRP